MCVIDSSQTLRLLRASAGRLSGREKDSIVEDLYFALNGEEMLRAVQGCASPHSVHAEAMDIMVVGHAPGCDEVVQFLADEKVSMAPGAAVVLEERDVQVSWDERVGWELESAGGTYRIAEVLNPKDLILA